MKLTKTALALAFSGLVVTSQAALAEPVYMIAQIQIEDQDQYFNAYGPAAIPPLAEHGAKVLVASPTTQLLEGEWKGNWTVVIEFASQESADGWYNSDEYQIGAIPLRLASTEFGNMIIVPAFAGIIEGLTPALSD